MSPFHAAFETFRRDPISSSLLFSLSVHLSLLALIQPESGGGGMPEMTVINARLQSVDSSPSPSPPADIDLEVPAKPSEEAAVSASPPTPAPPLLTSSVPSPAPPIPVTPTPDTAKPKEETPAPAAQAASSAPVQASQPAATAGQAALPQGSIAPIGIGIDSTWYLARQVDKGAIAIGSINPAYPDEARRREQEGSVKLMIKIDDLGRVRDAEVLEADPPGVFDEAALEAFKQARFQPAMKDGRPVRYQAYVRVTFKLND